VYAASCKRTESSVWVWIRVCVSELSEDNMKRLWPPFLQLRNEVVFSLLLRISAQVVPSALITPPLVFYHWLHLIRVLSFLAPALSHDLHLITVFVHLRTLFLAGLINHISSCWLSNLWTYTYRLRVLSLRVKKTFLALYSPHPGGGAPLGPRDGVPP